MDLSIIIPMYNAANYVDNCLKSIYLQRWLPTSFEVIIIDDGSTDGSASIVKKWDRLLPIKLLWQENQKQAAARNHGLDNASGKYVLFIDSDDQLDLNMIKIFFQAINAKYDLVEANINKIFLDSSGQPINRNTESPVIRKAKSKSELIKLYFGSNRECDVGLWNKLFRRSIIEKSHLRFSNGNFFEDSLFVGNYLNLIELSRIRFISTPLYNLYKRKSSTTTSFHDEIDALSDSYIKQCAALLKQTILSSKEQESLLAALRLRTWIYTIHHHIKYDDNWNWKQQRKYLLQKIGIGGSFSFIIPVKYFLAFWAMLISGPIYKKLYCKRYE